jgi:hypothetical protein
MRMGLVDPTYLPTTGTDVLKNTPQKRTRVMLEALEVDAKQLTSGCKTDAKPSKRQ